MSQKTFEELAEEVLSLPSRHKQNIVAIDGGEVQAKAPLRNIFRKNCLGQL